MIKLILDSARLNAAINANQITLADICKKLGVTRSAVSAWRAGTGVSLYSLNMLAKTLNVKPFEILDDQTLSVLKSVTPPQ